VREKEKRRAAQKREKGERKKRREFSNTKRNNEIRTEIKRGEKKTLANC